jgi:hypothetical protein
MTALLTFAAMLTTVAIPQKEFARQTLFARTRVGRDHMFSQALRLTAR